MNSHDPREHMRGIYHILTSDKKRIGFLFGAGTSLSTGIEALKIPAIQEMTEQIIQKVSDKSESFAHAVKGMSDEIRTNGSALNIESLLSLIESKRLVVGSDKLNGLDAKGFSELSESVRSEVVALVSVEKQLKPEDRPKLVHSQIANWISKARRRHPPEIFTTNYDYLFEIALEYAGLPYFDGFAGSFEPFFCPEAVEDMEAYPHLAKLWKMHGSLGWTIRETDNTVIRNKETPEKSTLIYPSHLKYISSKKQPYIGLIDRLCSFLQQDDAVLFTCGYSFGDHHINERIATSLRRGANSHVIALYFDEYQDASDQMAYALDDEENDLRTLASYHTKGQLSVYGRRHAIIGGRFGEWRLQTEPGPTELEGTRSYFKLDGPISGNSPEGDNLGDTWTGSGVLKLPDFARFAAFLNNLADMEPAPSVPPPR